MNIEIDSIDLLSDDFLNGNYKKKSDRAACEEIKYAIKEYINVNMPKDPEFVARISEHLETLLATFKNNWKELREALEKLREEVKNGRKQENTYGYESTHEMPFLGLLKSELFGQKSYEELTENQMKVLKILTDDVLSRLKTETSTVNFWEKTTAQQQLRSFLLKRIISSDVKKVVPDILKRRNDITQKLMDLGYQHYGRG